MKYDPAVFESTEAPERKVVIVVAAPAIATTLFPELNVLPMTEKTKFVTEPPILIASFVKTVAACTVDEVVMRIDIADTALEPVT